MSRNECRIISNELSIKSYLKNDNFNFFSTPNSKSNRSRKEAKKKILHLVFQTKLKTFSYRFFPLNNRLAFSFRPLVSFQTLLILCFKHDGQWLLERCHTTYSYQFSSLSWNIKLWFFGNIAHYSTYLTGCAKIFKFLLRPSYLEQSMSQLIFLSACSQISHFSNQKIRKNFCYSWPRPPIIR